MAEWEDIPDDEWEDVPESEFRPFERVQLGLSDAMSTVAGDVYGRTGDPTARDYLTASQRASTALFGNLAPAFGDVIAEGVIEGGKRVLPEPAQEAIASGVQTVVESPPAQGAAWALRALQENMPETSRVLGEGVNMAAILSPRRRIFETDVGTRAQRRVAESLDTERTQQVARMLEPDNMEGPGRITTEGPLRTKRYNPTDPEIRQIDEVASIDDVNPYGNYTDNVNAIESEVERLRKQLDDSLVGAQPIKREEINRYILEAIEDIQKNPTLVGDAGKSAERIYAKFDDLVRGYTDDAGNIAPGDLLKARRELDAWLKNNSPSIFDATSTNANRAATARLRQSINQAVSDAAPDANVAESLRRQSDLLTARDTMRPRSIAEEGNALSRAIANVERTTGVRHPTTPLAAGYTLTNLPIAAGTAALAVTVGSGKAASRQARKAMADALKAYERIVNEGGKLTAKMQADRAAMLAILNQGEDDAS